MKIVRSKKFIFACLIFLALPFCINFLSCIQAPYESWGNPSSWTVFWGQYFSGFVAFVMLYIAWKTLLTTKESNRPYIALDIVNNGYSRVFIRCRNIGHSTASDVKIRIDRELLAKVKISKVKESIESINKTSPFFLEPNGEKLWEIFLIPGTQLDYLNATYGKNALYEFKGQNIPKIEWKENEKLFQSNILNCSVTYNNEYNDSFGIDYNNIVYGISDAELISSYLNSITIQLLHIKEALTTSKNNGTEQNK